MDITCSELAVVDPVFSLLSCIRGRREALRREWSYASMSTKRCKAKDDFVPVVVAAIAELDEMEGLLDIPSIIPHTHCQSDSSLACAAGAAPSATVDAQRDAMQVFVVQRLRKRFNAFGTSTEHKDFIFGLDSGTSRKSSVTEVWLSKVMEQLKSKGSQGRMSEAKWRMIEEVTLRASQGWFIVFNTLTVDNTHYDEVFAKGADAWRYYVRHIDRAVGTELYGNVRTAEFAKKTDPFHSYFAIVERGSLHGRLHIHVIHCLRELPSDWKSDPNRCVGPSKNRQVFAMKKFWRFGHSMPIACRFSDFDAFGKLGWCWPVRQVSGKWIPIPAKPPIAIARYMCKYLLKAYSSTKGTYQWRTRISNGFGLSRMRTVLDRIDREDLWDYLQARGIRIRIHDVTLPSARLRIEALRSLLKQTRNGKPESESSLLQLQMMRKSLLAVSPQPPIVERLRSLMRPTTNFSLPSTGTFVVPTMRDTGGFNVRAAFESAYEGPRERFRAKAGTPRD